VDLLHDALCSVRSTDVEPELQFGRTAVTKVVVHSAAGGKGGHVKKPTRRSFLAQVPAVAVTTAAIVPAGVQAQEKPADKPVKKVHWDGGKPPEKTPLFSGVVSYGGLVFVSGIGAHFEGDIKAHTAHVLDEMKKRLEQAGSSMEKVLKVNVYLNDLKDYAAMNEVFLGRFGPEPGVRTTIAAAGGIPGNSLVEIDCIAAL
jgi:2-iminobutanoate/2-iminopropanoate deaminase